MPNRFLTTTAWVLERKTLEIVDQVISARLSGEVRDLSQFEFAARNRSDQNIQDEKPYQVIDGVAVINMIGVIGKRMNLFSEWSGGVSTERMQVLLEDALTDPRISAVVVKIDSPGGTVDGTFELCDWMLANRGVKPVYAFADGQCCSGAYAFAAVCDRVHGFRTAQIGSVSAVCCHYDRSGADEKAGIKRTFIVSGEYKRMANDAAPLDEQGADYLQGFIDRYHNMFVELTAGGRGMTPEDVQAKFGNGRVHLAAEALGLGMIDGIGTLSETINAARNAAMEEEAMTKEDFKAKHPELHAQLVAEAEAKAMAEFEGQVKVQGDALVAAEQTRLFGLYGKLHGQAAGESFAKLAGSGLTVAQLEGLEACGFGVQDPGKKKAGEGEKENEAGKEKEKTAKEKILDNLEKSSTELKSGAGGTGPADFMAAVDAVIERDRCTKIEALKKAAKEYPELHAAYRNGGAK